MHGTLYTQAIEGNEETGGFLFHQDFVKTGASRANWSLISIVRRGGRKIRFDHGKDSGQTGGVQHIISLTVEAWPFEHYLFSAGWGNEARFDHKRNPVPGHR